MCDNALYKLTLTLTLAILGLLLKQPFEQILPYSLLILSECMMKQPIKKIRLVQLWKEYR